MAKLLTYKDGEYFISFMNGNTPMIISKASPNGIVFTSKEKIRSNPAYYGGTVAYHSAGGHNWNRNVKLVGDTVYFIDTNCQLVEYDLSKLLGLPEAERANFAGKITKGGFSFEELCVDSEHRVTVVSKEGLLSHLTKEDNSVKVDVSKLASGKLGTQYGAVETLNGCVAVASFCPNTKLRAYSVFDANLKLLAFANTKAPNAYLVKNMLLFVKKDMLHILAAADPHEADLLVFDGNQTLHFVHTLKLPSHVYGVVWLKEGEEALICGYGTLKSIKLT